MITDRFRHTIIEVNSDKVLSRDLTVSEFQLQVNLSAPARVSFKVPQTQRYSSAFGINWKNWGQWIITEAEIDGKQRILSCCLVQENKLDPQSGDLQIDGIGFLGYAKGIPWLENFNPIAVDPAEVIQRIWAHLQNFGNANMGVKVLPASTDTQMLPGYGFDGSVLSFDFFAMFIRAIDFVDCGDTITTLARDLPLDLFEEASWVINPQTGEKELEKVLRIAYPLGGIQQDYLVFRLNENVINAEKAEELDIEPVSDVIIRSWLPGKVYTSQLSNMDPTRLRRTILEEDANINSTERAAAWAKRKLTRRNIPLSFSKIAVDMHHAHAPFGSYWVGDSIYVEAPNFPWYGDISHWHRITSITINEGQPVLELGLKVEGAFNYDPIEFDPDWQEKPTQDMNMLSNGYFLKSLAGWQTIRGTWIRMATQGYQTEGSVRIDCDDKGEELRSEKVVVEPGNRLSISAWVRFTDIVSVTTPSPPPYTMAIVINCHRKGELLIDESIIIDSLYQNGTNGFTRLTGTFEVPPLVSGLDVDEISLSLVVNSGVLSGVAWWDDVRIERL